MRSAKAFNRIAKALLTDFVRVYYIDATTGQYIWYSTESGFAELQLDQTGDDFYEYFAKVIPETVLFEEDKDTYIAHISKYRQLAKGEIDDIDDLIYRLLINGRTVYHCMQLLRKGEGYYIIGIQDIDAMMRVTKERRLFNDIAVSLADHYDTVYYVSISNGAYMEFRSSDLLQVLEDRRQGIDFFEDLKTNVLDLIYPDDQELVLRTLEKDRLLKTLNDRKKVGIEYRLMHDGRPVYVRLSCILSAEKDHIIICIENIDRETRELLHARETARRDTLTGVKNKLAYNEEEQSIQADLNNGIGEGFAIVICDINDLKQINDTLGHSKGDIYIKDSCSMICDVFDHSPVFRIGGDEFAVILKGRDYDHREDLCDRLKSQVAANIGKKSRPVIAVGMSSYDPARDRVVRAVFKRADALMYENKKQLKEPE